MARMEEGDTTVKVLMEDKPGHTKDIQKKLTLCLRSPNTVRFLCVLNFIMLVVIIALAVQVSRVRSTDVKNQICHPCEDDWIWYQGHCYYFSEEPDTWNNSQKFCMSHNASLALIDNQKELNFMNQTKGQDNHWIGLRRTDDNKDWIWTNDTIYNESLFKIVRSSNKTIEYVFLNHESAKSQQWMFKYKRICKK